jgi:hypothetical protein
MASLDYVGDADDAALGQESGLRLRLPFHLKQNELHDLHPDRALLYLETSVFEVPSLSRPGEPQRRRRSYHKAAGDYPPEEDRVHWRVSINDYGVEARAAAEPCVVI